MCVCAKGGEGQGGLAETPGNPPAQDLVDCSLLVAVLDLLGGFPHCSLVISTRPINKEGVQRVRATWDPHLIGRGQARDKIAARSVAAER